MSPRKTFILRFGLAGGITFVTCTLLVMLLAAWLEGSTSAFLDFIKPPDNIGIAKIITVFFAIVLIGIPPGAITAWLLVLMDCRRNLGGLAYAALLGGMFGALGGTGVGSIFHKAAPFAPEHIWQYSLPFAAFGTLASLLLAALLLPRDGFRT